MPFLPSGLGLYLKLLGSVLSGDTSPGGAESALLLTDNSSGLFLSDGTSFLLLAS